MAASCRIRNEYNYKQDAMTRDTIGLPVVSFFTRNGERWKKVNTRSRTHKQSFEPFSQEKKDARSTFSGSGLRLSITKSLVEHMGGTITLFSRENIGTKFVVEIPLKINQNPPREEEKQGSGKIEGRKVLLVEDNELNMEIASFMLEKNGILVTEAANGQEAVEIFASSREGEFDAILMDIMMPVMNGLEATRQIRSMNRKDAGTIPVFAMTANAFKDDMRASAQAGMNEHLTKPLDEKRILKTLRKYVS